MNSKTAGSLQRGPGRTIARALVVTATVLTTLLATLATSGLAAQAAKATPGVAKPTSFTAYAVRPDVAYGLLSPSSTYNQTQLLSGPNSAGRPIVLNIGGNVGFTDLLPSSTYTFQARNVKPGSTSSAWVIHTFTTPATFTARPAAPVNLRISASTATTVSVTWDAPAGLSNLSYEPRVNGARVSAACSIYCTDLELRTAIFAKPAPGTAVTFTVTARDTNFNLSLPATLLVTG